MGSASSAGNPKKNDVKVEEPIPKVGEEFKSDPILKEIIQNVEKEPLVLKPSQSVNLEKAKNETKVKKVRDVRSLQTIGNIRKRGDENEPYLHDVTMDEIEDLAVPKKTVRELNPVSKKKMASDRVIISQHSKTENLLSMNPLGVVESQGQFEGRIKKSKVSRML